MKILFANGRMCYPFFVGGDGVSVHHWLNFFQNEGHNCYHLGVIDPKNYPQTKRKIVKYLDRNNYEFNFSQKETELNIKNIKYSDQFEFTYKTPYQCKMVQRLKFLKYLQRTIKSFQPDIVLTQLEFSPKILQLTQDHNLPTIFFVHDTGVENNWTLDQISQNKKLIRVGFNSKFTRKKFIKTRPYLKGYSFITYPPISKEFYQVSNTEESITMINPIPSKGGKLFKRLVEKFPNHNFLAVEGWCPPEQRGINLKKYKNLTLLPKQKEMKTIYQRTKVLLVPSCVEEGFCRVIPEAGISGIPAIAHDIGGIPEAAGKGAILLDHESSLDTWAKNLKEILLKDSLYKRLSKSARENAKNFLISKTGSELLKIIKKTANEQQTN